jgi:hypothetical protein
MAVVGCGEAAVGSGGWFGFSNRLVGATHGVQVVEGLPVGGEQAGLDVRKAVLEAMLKAVGADDGPCVA